MENQSRQILICTISSFSLLPNKIPIFLYRIEFLPPVGALHCFDFATQIVCVLQVTDSKIFDEIQSKLLGGTREILTFID